MVLYTSGTTGHPKGAELSHSNQVMNALTCNRLSGSVPGEDVHLVALPLFHTFGATVNLNAGFSMGATLVLLPRFEPRQALDLLSGPPRDRLRGRPHHVVGPAAPADRW